MKKKLIAEIVLQFLQHLFLAKSNMLENIRETKLLQPISVFDEGWNTFIFLNFTCRPIGLTTVAKLFHM